MGIQNSLGEQIETPAFSVFGLVISFIYMEIISISQSTNVKKNGARYFQNIYTALSTSELYLKQRIPQDSLQEPFLNT